MKNKALLIYRLSAFAAGVGWFISILTNLLNGPQVFEFLQFISTEQFEYSLMLDYWMKMAGLAFAFIGIGFLYCAFKWKETLPYGIYFGLFQIIQFLSVIVTMARLPLDSQIYLMDCIFFLGTGIPMTFAWYSLKNEK